jgi:2-methylcitrate dehydratase PrpD
MSKARFSPGGTCGVFGAVAGIAALMGLDAKKKTWALGIAGSFFSGTLEGYTTAPGRNRCRQATRL